mmetsp:Transcript_18835/g.28642  ORF Transcript_18835/g.28642 Transcript_18835/m.28642 type:complete len:604 (-) Transcript_18835:29-1840(-)
MRLAAAAAIFHLLPLSCSFSLGKNVNSPFTPHRLPTHLSMSSSDARSETKPNLTNIADNQLYIEGLLQNLSAALDRWIVTGSMGTRKRAFNIMEQISRESMDEELIKQSKRMASRANMPLGDPAKAEAQVNERKVEAQQRRDWESKRQDQKDQESKPKQFAGNVVGSKPGRSALSRRSSSDGKPDIFMENFDGSLDPKTAADSKKALEDELADNTPASANEAGASKVVIDNSELSLAEARSSEIVAKAGSGSAFEGSSLGIGGLDNVLAQVKRRIWVPIAAPPSLLKELGINPVRGLLLYGLPGCGKTLLARSLAAILSPARPVTVVSGPEIMDKFVGSSEANLREIFDNPPEIYDNFRIGTKDNGAALSKTVMHVIILDEFDAMARARGGGGSSAQGDAGVARDSVVNQLLAKMDGIDPLAVPTLVVGLTNRRTLIEPALLRPGRFEVQIEVPKPKTVEQRKSILNVHMKHMFQAGRLFVRNPPSGTAASKRLDRYEGDIESVPSYDDLLCIIAVECDGMSGAELAGIARAAASRALERAVCDYSSHIEEGTDGYSISDCLVAQADIDGALDDIKESRSGGDGGEDEEEIEDSSDSSDSDEE